MLQREYNNKEHVRMRRDVSRGGTGEELAFPYQLVVQRLKDMTPAYFDKEVLGINPG
jgi:hypothetical protein